MGRSIRLERKELGRLTSPELSRGAAMIASSSIKFCPECGEYSPRKTRPPVVGRASGFIFDDNPTPVVEQIDGVFFANNTAWPDGVLVPITGFLERYQAPSVGVLRELHEELELEGCAPSLLGVYNYPQQNQITTAYHVWAEGLITLGDEFGAF